MVEYLEHFDEHRHEPNPERHWLTIPEAVAQLSNHNAVMGQHSARAVSRKKQTIPSHIQAHIAEELAKYSDEPFPLIALPNGAEVLLKLDEDGVPKLLDSELEQWRECLVEKVRPRHAPRISRAAHVLQEAAR